MKLALTLALTLALAVPVAPALAAEAVAAPRPATLTVNGEGHVAQAPDRALVSFRIESIDDQAGRATSQDNSVAAALTDALVRSGVVRTAIKTTSYSITFNPRPPKPDPNLPQHFGYIVERNVEVTVDHPDEAGAIVDAGVAAGVSGVNGVSFTLRDPQTAYRAALTAALADARLQALALAAAAHLRIVRILDIAPAGRLPQPVPLLRAARVPLAAAIPTELDPGSLTARATVTVRYQVAP